MDECLVEQTFRTSKGNAHSYTYIKSTLSLPTLFFLHGFPSHKNDWASQRDHFAKLGYGIVLLDILGFGRSDAPSGGESYHLESMSNEIVELLDHLQVTGSVIGIGHDLGVMLLSRLAAYHSARLDALIYIAVGPHKLAQRLDVDAINGFTKSILGHEYLGYISWMTTDPDAQQDLETHAESAMKLMFCEDSELWSTSFRPAGGMQAFVAHDQDTKIGVWFSQEMQQQHLERYGRPGGYKGAINWYKMMANNDSVEDEKRLEGQMMDKPSLLIVPEQEAVQQKETAAGWHTDLAVRTLECGHWVHLEKAVETNRMIEDFLTSLHVRK